jgi:hypothetical protein
MMYIYQLRYLVAVIEVVDRWLESTIFSELLFHLLFRGDKRNSPNSMKAANNNNNHIF